MCCHMLLLFPKARDYWHYWDGIVQISSAMFSRFQHSVRIQPPMAVRMPPPFCQGEHFFLIQVGEADVEVNGKKAAVEGQSTKVFAIGLYWIVLIRS